jgi:hypothetical protein
MRKIATKQEFRSMGEALRYFAKDIILEYLLVPFVFIIVFARIVMLMENTQNKPNYDWGNALALDMEKHWLLYLIIIVVWFVWVWVKARERNETVQLYKSMKGDIGDIKQSLKDKVTEIKNLHEPTKPTTQETTKNE